MEELWTRRFRYRGIPYKISMVVKDGKKYALLRYPEELNTLGAIVVDLFLNWDWLWKDTTYTTVFHRSDEDMIRYLHSEARQDINWLLDEVPQLFVDEIMEKAEKFLKLQEEIKRIMRGDENG